VGRAKRRRQHAAVSRLTAKQAEATIGDLAYAVDDFGRLTYADAVYSPAELVAGTGEDGVIDLPGLPVLLIQTPKALMHTAIDRGIALREVQVEDAISVGLLRVPALGAWAEPAARGWVLLHRPAAGCLELRSPDGGLYSRVPVDESGAAWLDRAELCTHVLIFYGPRTGARIGGRSREEASAHLDERIDDLVTSRALGLVAGGIVPYRRG
jgi:hypothetical protein